MTLRSYALSFLFLLSACVEEPTAKDSAQAAESIEDAALDTQIEQEQLSIEEAAEKAVRLIEEDAKADTEAAQKSK